VFVKYRCKCIADTSKMSALVMRCPEHNERIKDWGSAYKSPYRVVIHWRDGAAGFALHKVEYDEHGFPLSIEKTGLTPVFPTTAALAHETRNKGFTMDEVSNIFYDRYIEFKEFFEEETAESN
jgi:hypothetical protein